ncbi:MAG: heavy-metal-associated domain-containing protein [Chitinophagaceae bacterium]|nr:heavy-metal-associated domain-containing protein [Chitinophagaceae bacterium]
MKKTLVALSICIFLLLSADTNAQSVMERIRLKKQEAIDKLNAKIDQKTSQGIDSAMNTPEKVIKKKKEKKTDKKEKKKEKYENVVPTETAPSEKPNDNKEEETSEGSMAGEGAQTVIQTNIYCEAGKTKIEKMLKKQDGVFDVKANIKNGEVAIRYDSDGTSYTRLLALINEQGFVADGGKPATGAPANPCKK